MAVQRFCDQWLYLGVMVDSDEGIAEIDEDNNYAWAPVFLACPGITGNNISSCDLFYYYYYFTPLFLLHLDNGFLPNYLIRCSGQLVLKDTGNNVMLANDFATLSSYPCCT